LEVVNILKRVLNSSKEEVSQLLGTLSSKEDKIWPYEKWPVIKFKEGLVENVKGGHGPIRYSINKYIPNEQIEFKFNAPKGFDGVHRFNIVKLKSNKTEFRLTIEMKTTGIGIFTWAFVIFWLHNALFEDLMDKVENQFVEEHKKHKWNLWVKLLRKVLKPKSGKSV
jgi:hypothetical protein